LIKPEIEAEQSIIGAIVLDSEKVMPILLEYITDEHFLIPEYKAIIKRAISLYADNESVDLISLIANSQNADIKGLIVHCCELVPSIGNVEFYIKVVKSTYIRHKAYQRASEILEQIEAGEDILTLQNEVLKMSEIFSIQVSIRQMNATQLLVNCFSRITDGKPDYIKTGFSSFDKNTYIAQGDYVVIGARPSVGKTAFALNLMENISKAKRTVFFSLETSLEKLGDRYSSLVASINFKRIKDHELTEQDKQQFKDKVNKLPENSIFIEAAGWTVEQIRAKSLELKAEVIFIDYIGLITEQGKSKYEQMTSISNKIHIFAQSSKVTVFGLCQLNREAAQRTGEKAKYPSMADLRDSGAIEQDADTIIMLHREKLPDNKFNHFCMIEKNKEGLTGVKAMNFYPMAMKYEEVENRFEDGGL
jgi:replicative DNA helicase